MGRQGVQRSRVAAALVGTVWLAMCSLGCDSDEGSSAKEVSAEPGDAGKGVGRRSGASEDDEGKNGDGLSETVMTAAGPVRGRAVDHEGTRVLFFRGIPYAAAPAGELRWKPPQPVEPWTEVREATEWGDRSPQGESSLSNPGEISEDCLNLNLLTPADKAGEGLPVMVFFHGGGLSIGTGNSDTYCHTALPAQGVVVVTVNHRLGVMGYLSHPALAAESEEGSSGNYGTLDLIASLHWVHDNIEAFGGDPDNVTIFGESGGGSKVLSCMASPLARGLFHRAIIESGSRSSAMGAVTPKEQAEQGGVALATQLGIAPDADDVLAELRARSWQEILDAASAVSLRSNLSIDGWVLPQSVFDAFTAGDQSDVPLIVGANEGEVTEFSGTVPTLAASMASVPSEAYVYSFSHVPVGWRTESCSAFHGLELPYVFGHLEGLASATIVLLGSRSCPTSSDPQVGEQDVQAADNSMKIWAQFARTGEPSVPGLIDWPPYTADGDQYLDIAAELEVKSGVANIGQNAGAAEE